MASAGGGFSGGSSRRKSLDAELNLVPFIDLLSTCICFLLMTAVWMEIGSLQVKQATGTEAPQSSNNQLEMDVKFAGKGQLDIFVKGGKKSQKYSIQGSTEEERTNKLSGTLDQLKGQVFSMARVTTALGVNYGEMVSVMDVLRHHGIVNLGVVPVRK